MIRRLILLLDVTVLLLASACGSTPAQPAAASSETEPLTTASPTPMPTNTPQPPSTELPPSARLGAVLTGSGVVDRSLLTYDDLMAGLSTGPLDDSAFALPEAAAAPAVVFEGRLHLSANVENGRYKLIRDDQNLAADPARMQLPEFELEFVQDGSYLIPVTQGLVFSGNPYWNYIIGPGRIWQENPDNGYARLSFPFALVMRNQNCTHNGVMAFLFNGTSISQVRYQITQETCLYFKFDLWGQLTAAYTPETIPNASTIKAEHAAEVADRLPARPISALPRSVPVATRRSSPASSASVAASSASRLRARSPPTSGLRQTTSRSPGKSPDSISARLASVTMPRSTQSTSRSQPKRSLSAASRSGTVWWSCSAPGKTSLASGRPRRSQSRP